MRVVSFIIVCTILGTTPFAVAQEKPNVVMILADDIGYGDIGVYGGKIPTPNIDRLAQKGMLTIREYFGRDNPVENELRDRITRLWEKAQWSWYLQSCDKMLTWHWSTNYDFAKNHKFRGFLVMCSDVCCAASGSYTRAVFANSCLV